MWTEIEAPGVGRGGGEGAPLPPNPGEELARAVSPPFHSHLEESSLLFEV